MITDRNKKTIGTIKIYRPFLSSTTTETATAVPEIQAKFEPAETISNSIPKEAALSNDKI